MIAVATGLKIMPPTPVSAMPTPTKVETFFLNQRPNMTGTSRYRITELPMPRSTPAT